MINNYYGTLVRILLLAIGLLCFWFASVFLLYAIGSLIFGYEVRFAHLGLLFVGVLLLKAFYPKNVFSGAKSPKAFL
jgi:hypothetical protein